MSFFPGKDPVAGDQYQCDAIKTVIVPRTADLGDGFTVRRALPSVQSRMVGPFVFFDHFGPTVFRAGTGLDVFCRVGPGLMCRPAGPPPGPVNAGCGAAWCSHRSSATGRWR